MRSRLLRALLVLCVVAAHALNVSTQSVARAAIKIDARKVENRISPLLPAARPRPRRTQFQCDAAETFSLGHHTRRDALSVGRRKEIDAVDGEVIDGAWAVGAMRKRRTLMADGRYLIYFTFGDEDEATPVATLPAPVAEPEAEEERSV